MTEQDQFDRAVGSLQRLLALAHAGDKLQEARELAKPKCGNCRHWMIKKECARERSGARVSMSSTPCSDHSWTKWALDLVEERQADAATALAGASHKHLTGEQK